MEHERQRALQRKIFEDQMRALEQQQARELLALPLEAGLAVSAPTTPPRVNVSLNDEMTSGLGAAYVRTSVDAESLSKAVGSASDKRKSVTYAPSVNHSPEMPTSNMQSFARPGGAKSMPASRRTSASEHDEELAGHLQGLTLAGERAERERMPVPSGAIPQSILRSTSGFAQVNGQQFGNVYNAGMMLDEQLDQEMNSELPCIVRDRIVSPELDAMRNLPTSDEDKFARKVIGVPVNRMFQCLENNVVAFCVIGSSRPRSTVSNASAQLSHRPPQRQWTRSGGLWTRGAPHSHQPDYESFSRTRRYQRREGHRLRQCDTSHAAGVSGYRARSFFPTRLASESRGPVVYHDRSFRACHSSSGWTSVGLVNGQGAWYSALWRWSSEWHAQCPAFAAGGAYALASAVAFRWL